MLGEVGNWELQPLKNILRRGLRANAFERDIIASSTKRSFDPASTETLLLSTKCNEVDLPTVDGNSESDELIQCNDQELIILSSPLSLPSPIAPTTTAKETIDAACQVNDDDVEASPMTAKSIINESNTSNTSPATTSKESTRTAPPPPRPPPSPSPSLPPPSPPSESRRDKGKEEDEHTHEYESSDDSQSYSLEWSEALNETTGTIPPFPPPPTRDGADDISRDATEYTNDTGGFESISSSGESYRSKEKAT